MEAKRVVDPGERFMRRALELAGDPPFTSPNPRVGVVVARDGVVIGEGVHRGTGTPHAEVDALEAIDARGATLFVTLEPCVHQGRTPPCVPKIVAAGIAHVVAAIEDPDPRVSGRGFDVLRAEGVRVTTGVCADEARLVNRAYLHHRATRRPLLTLKLAMTLDGKIAARNGTSRWITGPDARARVHRRRVEVDAVMVGAGTVIADDPELSAREGGAERQPRRVVLDATGRIPATARVFGSPGETTVITTIACPHGTLTAWKEAGAEVLVLPAAPDGNVALTPVIDSLGARGWIEVYCEGGARLATSLLKEGAVDRLELYQGPLVVGEGGLGIGDLGVATIDGASRWTKIHTEDLAGDTLVILDRVA